MKPRELAKKLIHPESMHRREIEKAVVGLIINLAYALYNGALGIALGSAWFGAACGYHLLLTVMRSTVIIGHKKGGVRQKMLVSGVLLSVSSIVLAMILYMSISQSIAQKHGEITMITIATYTFYKITMSAIRAAKKKQGNSDILSIIRTIRYSEVAVSLATMQRSMLVSFGSMEAWRAASLNIFTGTGACLFSLALGINLICKSRKE